MSNGDFSGSLAEPRCQACDRHHYVDLFSWLYSDCNVADLQHAHKMAISDAFHLREQAIALGRLRASTRSKHTHQLEEAIHVKLVRRDMLHNIIMHHPYAPA